MMPAAAPLAEDGLVQVPVVCELLAEDEAVQVPAICGLLAKDGLALVPAACGLLAKDGVALVGAEDTPRVAISAKMSGFAAKERTRQVALLGWIVPDTLTMSRAVRIVSVVPTSWLGESNSSIESRSNLKEKPKSWWPPGGFLVLGPGPARVVLWPSPYFQKYAPIKSLGS
jgi:hypothetical protein